MAFPVCHRTAILAALILLPALTQFPQDKKTRDESSEQTPLTFKVPIGVVVVNANVTDERGNPVTDLTREDFRVYEDGKLQSIQTFALESYNPANSDEKSSVEPALSATDAAEPGFSRPRLISIMIDDVTSSTEDSCLRVAEAVASFIENDMNPGDQVGIWSGSGKVNYPFSNNKQMLLEQVAVLPKKLNRSRVERSECPVLTDLQAQKIVNNRDPDSLNIAVQESMRCLMMDSERKPMDQGEAVASAVKKMNMLSAAESHARMEASRQYQETMYRNRNLLAVLRRHLRSLRHFDAGKSLIFFSGGFLHQDLVFELQDVVEQALRSGVVLNTVDIRGVYDPSYIPVDERIVTTGSLFSRKREEYRTDAASREEPLSQMANDTGGFFFHNNNDIYNGIRQISGRQEYYYILTYAIPPQKPDGRFHAIKVAVTRPGVQVSYRKGYYAPREEVTFERRKTEDILEALQAPGDLNEIPMTLSYNSYQDDDTTYNISLLMKIGIKNLRFLDEDSRHKNMISMVVAAYDEADRYVNGVEKSVDFRLTDASYIDLLDRGVTSRIELKLPIGRYRIKAVVREAAQGKMSSLTKAIDIP
ncbi:MAG: VWA domain-containing protein [Acidobacteria bacterium]|nr:VWA domain-containing protein [Acidobacteriota bacterium]